MYKNYIFDLYGTLIDIRTNEQKTYLWKKMSEIYSAYGAVYTAKELRSAYQELVAAHEKELPKNGEIDLNQVFAELFTCKGIACASALSKHVAITFRSISRQKLCVYDHVKETLEELKKRGKKIYLLSNAQSDFTRPEIEMLGLTSYFDGIFISSEVGYKKPSSDFFNRLLAMFRLEAKDCLMVGNDESADIQGAHLVEMDSLYLHTEISPKEDTSSTATYVVMDGDWGKVSEILLK
jgi:putative hydrolase of the HAD superfamily